MFFKQSRSCAQAAATSAVTSLSSVAATTSSNIANRHIASAFHRRGCCYATAGLTKNNNSNNKFDVLVIGGGHNGLTCAAYLARAGKRVAVLEKQNSIGGACTIETWPIIEGNGSVDISPCAYLLGLLDATVARELDIEKYGFEWFPSTLCALLLFWKLKKHRSWWHPWPSFL